MMGLISRSIGAAMLIILLIVEPCVCVTPGASPGSNAGKQRRQQVCRSGDHSLLATSHKLRKAAELEASGDSDEAPAPLLTARTVQPTAVEASLTNLAAMEAFVQSQVEHALGARQQGGNATNMSEGVLNALDVIRLHIKTLNVSVLIQHREDQGEITDSLALIGECAKEQDLQSVLGEHRRGHSSCRTEEAGKAQVKGSKCQKYNMGRLTDFSKPPTCSLGQVATTNSEELEAFEDCLRKFSVWFGVWDLYKECRAARQEHGNQTALCNAKQSTFEESSCVYASKMTGFCGCRSRSTEFYESRSAAVKRAEVARKADYQAARRIDCLLDVWTSVTAEGKNETLSNCTEMEIDTDHLSIDYGSVPGTELDCSATPAKTCDDDWLKSEYESTAWYVAAPTAPCTPCPTPTTTAPPAAEHFSCKAWHDQGQTTDGVYDISIVDLDGRTMQVKTYCDMTNGGWTLVGQMHGFQNVEHEWLRTLHNEAALRTSSIEDGWACIPAVDMAVNRATSVRFSNSDVSKYVWWDMDRDRSRGTWWNHAAGQAAVWRAADHTVVVQDQDGNTKHCYQNAYGIMKLSVHGGSYPAATLDKQGNAAPGDLCMAVGVSTGSSDSWSNIGGGWDAPRSDSDWPNRLFIVPPHISVWLK